MSAGKLARQILRAKRMTSRDITVLLLMGATAVLGGCNRNVCADLGRKLTERELVERALLELPGTGWIAKSPIYDQLSPSEKGEFAKYMTDLVRDETGRGVFLKNHPSCCVIVEPRAFSRSGWPSSPFSPLAQNAYKAIKAAYKIDYRLKPGNFIQVEIIDGIMVNSCGNTAGISG